jgi:polysaccharide export outer membrane protein
VFARVGADRQRGAMGTKMFFRAALGCFLFLLVGSVGMADTAAEKVQNEGPGEAPNLLSSEYVIGLGDLLQVMVWKEAELSQEMAVRIDGRISLPLVGDVAAAGKTVTALATELEKRFSEVVSEPSVTVMLRESRSWRYYIIGQVGKPGEFPIEYPITILQAIARSGGFLEWAKKEDISVFRQEDGKDTIIKFNYESLVKGKDLAQNIMMRPGDTIIIP